MEAMAAMEQESATRSSRTWGARFRSPTASPAGQRVPAPAARRSDCSEAMQRICSGLSPQLQRASAAERRPRWTCSRKGCPRRTRSDPGGTRENSVWRSAGIHQAVSKSRLRVVRRHPPDPGQVTNSPRGPGSGGRPETAQPAPRRAGPARGYPAGMNQDGHGPLLGASAASPGHGGMVKGELLGPGMKLDPPRPPDPDSARPQRRRPHGGRHGRTAPAVRRTPPTAASAICWPGDNRRAHASGRRTPPGLPPPATRPAAPRAAGGVRQGSFCPRWVWASNSSMPGTCSGPRWSTA